MLVVHVTNVRYADACDESWTTWASVGKSLNMHLWCCFCRAILALHTNSGLYWTLTVSSKRCSCIAKNSQWCNILLKENLFWKRIVSPKSWMEWWITKGFVPPLVKINSAKGHKKRALEGDPAEGKRMYQSSNYINCNKELMVEKTNVFELCLFLRGSSWSPKRWNDW